MSHAIRILYGGGKIKMIENTNEIKMFLHCGKCLREYQADEKIKTTMSPMEYANTQSGWTKRGIQVWCNRHDCNIIHIDFEGTKHHANTTATSK